MAKRKKSKKKLTQKQVRRNFRKAGAKMLLQRKKLKKVSKEDRFLDESMVVNADNAMITHPNASDIRDEISGLDSFRDWARESRGNSLTFGDY